MRDTYDHILKVLGQYLYFWWIYVIFRVHAKGRYPESFMLVSLLEVCQEWGLKKVGTWRMLRVPDWRLGGLGHL